MLTFVATVSAELRCTSNGICRDANRGQRGSLACDDIVRRLHRGPCDGMDWAFGFGKPAPVAQEIICSTGAVLAGRRGYDLGTRTGGGPRGIYGGAWSWPLFVLTHRPDDAAEPGTTFLSGSIESAVTAACAAAGGKKVGILGASIARQCLEHGLLDEIVVHLVPVLLGEAVRFYDAPASGRSVYSARLSMCQGSSWTSDSASPTPSPVARGDP